MILEEIAKRDTESAETWFKPFQGPQQFGAAGRAFVDRRWLLAHISDLRNDLTAARLERDEARRCAHMLANLHWPMRQLRAAMAGDIGWVE